METNPSLIQSRGPGSGTSYLDSGYWYKYLPGDIIGAGCAAGPQMAVVWQRTSSLEVLRAPSQHFEVTGVFPPAYGCLISELLATDDTC